MVAKSWKTRIGSSELSTVTALVRRSRSVRTAAAPRTTAGDETTKSGRWCAEDVQLDLVGEHDLREQVPDALLWRDVAAAQLRERVDPDLHQRLWFTSSMLCPSGSNTNAP